MINDEQLGSLEEMRSALEERLASKPKRYTHSLGVARTAVELAVTYGVDEYPAAVAGLLHDWDKVLDDAELLARAAQASLPVAGSPSLAVGLLHGPLAAQELPGVFPGITDEVLSAIARHTVGATDMSDLDMVVFVADAIEPGRRGVYAERLRSLVGAVSLEELFFECFSQGLLYVISSGRYLYPTAVTIYNHYATKRAR